MTGALAHKPFGPRHNFTLVFKSFCFFDMMVTKPEAVGDADGVVLGSSEGEEDG
jgi:hypothetical protein